MATPRTSQFEKVTVKPDFVELHLDGRRIGVMCEPGGLLVTAFQDLQAELLAGFEKSQTEPAKEPGFLGRIGAWFGRFVRPPGSGQGVMSAACEVVDSERSTIGIPRSSEGIRSLVNEGQQPLLDSIFADQSGVHVSWRIPGPAKGSQPLDLTYGLDSEVGRKLDRCFDVLLKLGYELKGFDALRPASIPLPVPEAQAPKSASTAAPAPISPASATVDSGIKAEAKEQEAPKTKEPRQLVFRLHLRSAEAAARMVVTPVDEPDKPQILVAPERLVRALQAASAESRAEGERVTFVRCVNGEKGLKVVEVGLGLGAEREPARWQEAASWWEKIGKDLAKPPPATSQIPGPDFTPGASPLQTGAEPALG